MFLSLGCCRTIPITFVDPLVSEAGDSLWTLLRAQPTSLRWRCNCGWELKSSDFGLFQALANQVVRKGVCGDFILCGLSPPVSPSRPLVLRVYLVSSRFTRQSTANQNSCGRIGFKPTLGNMSFGIKPLHLRSWKLGRASGHPNSNAIKYQRVAARLSLAKILYDTLSDAVPQDKPRISQTVRAIRTGL